MLPDATESIVIVLARRSNDAKTNVSHGGEKMFMRRVTFCSAITGVQF
jgi:hypothetical protein